MTVNHYQNGKQLQEQSLTSKVVRGAKWVFIGGISARAVELIKAIVLARLLIPEDFGLFGLVMLALMVLDIFSQTGFNAALIQHKGNTHEYLDTAWTVQIARGMSLALILFLSAPIVGWFFREHRIVQLLRIMCIVPIIQGFINIGIIYFQKELEFHKQFLYNILSSFISLLFGIVLAYMLRSVWALIWSNIAAFSTRLVLSYVIISYRPKIHFVKTQAIELFHFGKWITGYNMVLFLWQQLDKFFIGKILGPVALGLYQIAQRIADLPASQIAAASVNFTFPAYSKIQSEKDRLKKAFMDVFETIMSLVLPISIFIFFASSDIVYGLLGEKWKGSIVPLKILSIVGFMTAFDVMSAPLFIGIGRPNIEFWKNFLKVLIMLITIYPLTKYWGLSGTCISLLFGSVAILPVWAKVTSIADISWRDILLRISAPLAIGIAVALSIKFTHMLTKDTGIVSLIVAAVASLLLYISGSIIIGKAFHRGIFVHLQRIKKGLSTV